MATASLTSPATPWNDFRVAVFNGQHDTRIETGEDYATISLAELFAMPPMGRDKRNSPACIPSSYCGHDAREHARQREVGSFVALCGDVDRGNHELEKIRSAVEALCADAAWMIYSSAHARDSDMRWRIIIPLAAPVSFADWYDAQNAFFTVMESAGIEMDHALDRAAQPVYLPNIPAIHAKSGAPLRDSDGDPIYYRTASTGTDARGLSIDKGVIAGGIAAIRGRRAQDDAERERIRKTAQQRRANRPNGDGTNVIADFNAGNAVETMLEICGYEQSPRDARDWRSPLQTGDTYATRVMDEKWVSLSSSDAAAGVGEKCSSGCYGDAYDLLVHFKYGGDHKAAFRDLHAERRATHPNIIYGAFTSEPPDIDGDPGWQAMPEWCDAGEVAVAPPVTSDRERSAQQNAPAPLVLSATPYLWCDPATIPPRRWVYGRSIQRGHLRAVVAQGAAGKTILSIGEALAMVTGRDLLGQPVPGGPKRVWLWNLEDDREELSRIIQAACKHWKITPADLDGRLFVDSALDGAPLKLATSTPAAGLVINRPLVEALTAELKERGIDYLHVDPFVSSHGANESDNMEIDAIAKEWALVAKNADCGVGLAHHVSKAGAAEATALSARGAVALVNACRSVLTLNRMGEDEARRYGIEEDRRRRYFRTYDDKNNRAPPSDKSDWFTMLSVSLGNDVSEFADNSDSIGVVVPWSPPDAFEGVTADHLLRVQKMVDGSEYRKSPAASDWVGKAVAEVMNLSAEKADLADRAKINRLLGTWFATGALAEEVRKDKTRQDRTYVVVGEWAVQDVAPVRTTGAVQGGAGVAPTVHRSTPPPERGGGGAHGAVANSQLVQNEGGAPNRWHANPALGRSPGAMILAPGESEDDPVEHFNDINRSSRF